MAFGILTLPLFSSSARAQVPARLNYQGRISSGNSLFNGTGQFKFALVNTNGTQTFWSSSADANADADGEPDLAVSLPVTRGLYSVQLGDSTLANMSALPATVVTNGDVHLRVWFNDGTTGFQRLSPDVRLASVAFSFLAANVADGAITSAKLQTEFHDSLARLNSSPSFSGTVTAPFFTGSGAHLTNLPSAGLTGSMADERLSANVALLNSSQTFSDLKTFSPASGAPFAVGSATKVTLLNADLLDGMEATAFWKSGGNSDTTAGTHFLGTTDSQALEFKVNNQRALRLQPGTNSVSIVGGMSLNSVSNSLGAVIAGGGFDGNGGVVQANLVLTNYGTVSGGLGNTVGGYAGTVSGGEDNSALGSWSLAGGRRAKANHDGSFVWADSQNADFSSTTTNQFLIRAEGGVGIGMVPETAVALDVNGLVRAVAFVSSSDRRLKYDIAPIRSVLDQVDALRPVSYRLINASNSTARSVGFIAQEVEEIFPEFVREMGQFKGLVYTDFVPVAIRAVQELHLKVRIQQSDLDQKEARILQLEEQVTALNEKFQALEKHLLRQVPSLPESSAEQGR